MNNRYATSAVLLLLSVAGIGHAQEAPKGDVARGRELFVADGCFQCHGRVGQGGRGSVLIPFRMPYEAYRVMVRSPVGAMPAYTEKVFPDQALADTYAYLKSLPGPLEGDKLPALLKP